MMNRTERLLNLLQILRSYRYPVSGERLAERCGVSIRTLYRDIATLRAQGAEIEGEVGIGYVLKPSFFLPPLMLTAPEIDALLLGMRWVTQYGDAPLMTSAVDALAKVTSVLPPKVKNSLNAYTLRAGPPASMAMRKENLSVLRDAIADQRKIEIIYKAAEEKVSQRIIWPFSIGYFVDGRILVAWCEQQQEFRHFKTDKITSLKVLDERYPRAKDRLFREWQSVQLKKTKTNSAAE
jgi:predicted DNA-binding transcriptional regulator YafY